MLIHWIASDFRSKIKTKQVFSDKGVQKQQLQFLISKPYPVLCKYVQKSLNII